MKVYIVTRADYDGTLIEAVFNNKQLAERYRDIILGEDMVRNLSPDRRNDVKIVTEGDSKHYKYSGEIFSGYSFSELFTVEEYEVMTEIRHGE